MQRIMLISFMPSIHWLRAESFCKGPLFAAMPAKRRRINGKEDWADAVVETALTQDWVTRHETLDQYLQSKSLKDFIPERLSPSRTSIGVRSRRCGGGRGRG